MARLRLRHLPLVLAALARWLLGSSAGRKLLAVGVAAAALVVVASRGGGSDAAKRHRGTWSGFGNEYAPTRGDLVIEGQAGSAASCQVRGRTSWTSGDGWVFRGDASVAETASEVRIAKNGRVSGGLKLEKRWRGRVKGIGGDWEDTSGTALCAGDLDGTLSAGGTWEGKCTTGDKEYSSRMEWTLSAD